MGRAARGVPGRRLGEGAEDERRGHLPPDRRAARPAARRGLRRGSGRVINIGSIDGLRTPAVENYSYSASKSAVHMLTRHLAKRLVSEHITVNAIAPGPFESRMMAWALDDPERRAAVEAEVPMGRIGRARRRRRPRAVPRLARRAPTSPARSSRSTAGSPAATSPSSCSVSGSGSPPNHCSSTRRKSGSSGAARAKRVIEERSLSASIGRAPSRRACRVPRSAFVHSRRRGPSTGCGQIGAGFV